MTESTPCGDEVEKYLNDRVIALNEFVVWLKNRLYEIDAEQAQN